MLTTADDFSIFLYGQKAHPILFFSSAFRELRDPLFGILSRLAHPDRHIITFAKINVLPQHRFHPAPSNIYGTWMRRSHRKVAKIEKLPVHCAPPRKRYGGHSTFRISADNFL